MKTSLSSDVSHIMNDHPKSDHVDVSDYELIEQTKHNPEKFGILIERYWQPLERYLRRITSFSKEEIEDVLQEVFLKAYRKLNEYDADIRFGSFLYRIAHNQAIDTIRRANARPKAALLDDDEWRELFVATTDMERELATKETLLAIREALMSMPDTYREALILRFLEEKSYEEIMDILEKPKGSVATLIARGRKLLLTELEKNFHGSITL